MWPFGIGKSNYVDTIEDKLRKAGEKFCEENNCKSHPWQFYALSQREDDPKKYWLNPNHQQHLNSHYCTEEDLEQWLEGKGPIVKEGMWDELVFICKFGLEFHWWVREHFNWYVPKYENDKSRNVMTIHCLDWNDENGAKEVIKDIEQYWKYRIVRELEEDWCITPKSLYDLKYNKQRELDEEMFGYFNALHHMGMGDFQACNTPQTRSNFSWWSDIIKKEAEIEWLIKSKQITKDEAENFMFFERKD